MNSFIYWKSYTNNYIQQNMGDSSVSLCTSMNTSGRQQLQLSLATTSLVCWHAQLRSISYNTWKLVHEHCYSTAGALLQSAVQPSFHNKLVNTKLNKPCKSCLGPCTYPHYKAVCLQLTKWWKCIAHFHLSYLIFIHFYLNSLYISPTINDINYMWYNSTKVLLVLPDHVQAHVLCCV